MSTTESNHVKITVADIYREQQEMKQILIQLSAKLDTYGNLPDRVTKLELQQAESAWVPKVLWGALTAGITGFIIALYNLITGA
jgi:hypothetical protein